jgi:hypothetical protein
VIFFGEPDHQRVAVEKALDAVDQASDGEPGDWREYLRVEGP